MHELPGSSPLSFVRGVASSQQQAQQYQAQKAPSIEPPAEPDEINAERIYRDAANFCEVAAPVALGSAVVFAFHSMQVAGGAVFAIGLYQIYLAAKITGQSGNRWASAIVGVGVTGGMIASFAEPITESRQASTTKYSIAAGIKEVRAAGKPSQNIYLNYLPPIALSIIVFCLFLKLRGGRK